MGLGTRTLSTTTRIATERRRLRLVPSRARPAGRLLAAQARRLAKLIRTSPETYRIAPPRTVGPYPPRHSLGCLLPFAYTSGAPSRKWPRCKCQETQDCRVPQGPPHK